jgi:hypothetical protein
LISKLGAINTEGLNKISDAAHYQSDIGKLLIQSTMPHIDYQSFTIATENLPRRYREHTEKFRRRFFTGLSVVLHRFFRG